MKNVYTGISILTRGIRGRKLPSQSFFMSSPYSPPSRFSWIQAWSLWSTISRGCEWNGGGEKQLSFRRGRRLLIPPHWYDEDRRLSIANYMHRNHIYGNRWRPRHSTQSCQKDKSTLGYFLLLPSNPIFLTLLTGYLKNPFLTQSSFVTIYFLINSTSLPSSLSPLGFRHKYLINRGFALLPHAAALLITYFRVPLLNHGSHIYPS